MPGRAGPGGLLKFGPVPLSEALGRILAHNVAGADGRRALRKGRPLTAADLESLRALGRTSVSVATLEEGDVAEDEAAARIAAAAAGGGLAARPAAAGRANVTAGAAGVLRLDADRLAEINGGEGVTVATLPANSAVPAGALAATVKVLPYALAAEAVARAESLARSPAPLLAVDPFRPHRTALLLAGSPAAAERLRREFEGPLAERIAALGSRVEWTEFVALDDQEAAGEEALAAGLRRLLDAGAELVLLAGETAIADRNDVAPRAIARAGGRVESFGAPVDPGNFLLLASVGRVPVVGAPGCARSRRPNVVDAVLPRLLAGERLTRREVARLGAGGLLEDVPERPVPRARPRDPG